MSCYSCRSRQFCNDVHAPRDRDCIPDGQRPWPPKPHAYTPPAHGAQARIAPLSPQPSLTQMSHFPCSSAGRQGMTRTLSCARSSAPTWACGRNTFSMISSSNWAKARSCESVSPTFSSALLPSGSCRPTLLTYPLIGRIISISNITPEQTGMAVSASKAQPYSVLCAENLQLLFTQSPGRQILYVCRICGCGRGCPFRRERAQYAHLFLRSVGR
jgi:hypothetical protein